LLLIWLSVTHSDKLSFFHTQPYPQQKLTQSSISGFAVYMVQSNNLCWDQFPCTYYISDKIMLRTPDINDGFKVKE
jgi:hypothetical protein